MVKCADAEKRKAKDFCILQIKQRNAYFNKYVTNLKILVSLYSK